MTDMTITMFRSARSTALISVLALACGASFAGGGHGHDKGHKGDREYKHGHGYKEDKHGKNKYHHDDRRTVYRTQERVYSHDTRTVNVVRNVDVKTVNVKVGTYFVDRQRTVLNTYYGDQFRSGHCPPGLAKKDNGCRPPGQVRSYVMGQRLPASVVYYPVPQPVIAQIGVAPSGYRYVRVASDILLLSVGTSMVVDAIQDLGGR